MKNKKQVRCEECVYCNENYACGSDCVWCEFNPPFHRSGTRLHKCDKFKTKENQK